MEFNSVVWVAETKIANRMPSISLQKWQESRRLELDEIVEAHRAVGGTGRGRRYATEQVNRAYAVLLSSHFQGFCRDLHSECVQHIVQQVPTALQNVLRGALEDYRDRGNADPDKIAKDFARLGLQKLWDKVKALDTRNEARRQLLKELNNWRNAIAHQHFDPAKLGDRTTLRLNDVNGWRRACNELARAFDKVTRAYISTLLGSHPW
jgi:hypothetical protein